MRSDIGFRIDRALTLLLFARPSARARRRVPDSVPILMYHSVSDDLDHSTHPYFRTVTSPATFAAQVEALQGNGLQGITFGDALDRLGGGLPGALDGKVVMTFDDGFRDFLSHAHPVLARAGFGATVFLPSSFLGGCFLTGRNCLSPVEVRELAGLGVEFGSHSASHRRLVELPQGELRAELQGSRHAIEDVLGSGVDLFSYPYRFPEENIAFTTSLRELLLEVGYRGGVTTCIGTASRADDTLFLPRLPVNDCDDQRLLLAKVHGHYDWLRFGQRMRKRSRALMSGWRVR